MENVALYKLKHPIEVVKAHAMLEIALENGLLTDPRDLDRGRTALNVLCWVLDHSESSSPFDVVLAKLQADIRIDIVEAGPMPAGVH
jgi:hypothetical protein